MRFTAVQRFINNERDWLFEIRVEYTVRITCVFWMRFQREFDKYKNVGGGV